MWNVIVICDDCRLFQNIPIHRVLPATGYSNIFNKLTDLIKNPDFDTFEFQKYINKLDNVDFRCLTNKTLHFCFFEDHLVEKNGTCH